MMHLAESFKVNSKVVDLIAKLKENMARHGEVFAAALEAYNEECIKHFQKNLELANEGEEFHIRPPKDVIKPRDHTSDYEQALEMLRWEIREEIEVSGDLFRAFVLDKWDWTEVWLSNKYAASSSRAWHGD